MLTTERIGRSATEHVSHFDRREALRAVADNLPNGAPAHEVEEAADAFLASEEVMRIAETLRGPRFTTRGVRLPLSSLSISVRWSEARAARPRWVSPSRTRMPRRLAPKRTATRSSPSRRLTANDGLVGGARGGRRAPPRPPAAGDMGRRRRWPAVR